MTLRNKNRSKCLKIIIKNGIKRKFVCFKCNINLYFTREHQLSYGYVTRKTFVPEHPLIREIFFDLTQKQKISPLSSYYFDLFSKYQWLKRSKNVLILFIFKYLGCKKHCTYFSCLYTKIYLNNDWLLPNWSRIYYFKIYNIIAMTVTFF